MTDLEKIWKQIEKDFNDSDDIDTESYLDEISLSYAEIPESIYAESEDLVGQVFNEDSLVENSKLSKYKILKKIDSGGQSEIYLAERSDGVYQKTVVIKFISAQYSYVVLQQQFMQEMQLLADLNHPGIVPIIDGGLTDNDQPWLVLDYIDGLTIDQYCLETQSDHKSILRQMIKLCDALDFVHQNGAVHMDIKPSNILVKEINNTPYPVLIDFGIALTAMDQKSESRLKFGTPGYSAPEQIKVQQTDFRVDIYSIGILLAQLLTQRSQKNFGLLTEKQRIRTLNKNNVAKDLIQIIYKCTHLKPDDRYKSAESIRNDLNNYLNDMPLMGNRDQFFHVMIKTIKRNQVISWFAFMVLISSIFFGLKYTKDVTDLQVVTLKEKNASNQLLNFMQNDLFQDLKEIGRMDILQQVTDQSIQHLQNQDYRSLDEEAHYQTSIAYANAGKVYDDLDQSEKALKAFDEALKSIAFLIDSDKYYIKYLRQNALIRVLKARTLTAEGQNQKTTQNLFESLVFSKQLNQKNPQEDYFLQYEASTQLGWHFLEYDEPEQALLHINKAVDFAEQELKISNDNLWNYYLTQALQVLAWYEFDYGSSEQAVKIVFKATQKARVITNIEPSNIRYTINLATLLNQLSYFHLEMEHYSKAQESVEESIKLGLILQQRAPNNLEYLRELAYSYTTFGEISEWNQNIEQAFDSYQKGLEISKQLIDADKDNYSKINDYAIDLIHLGDILVKLEQQDQADKYWQQASDQISMVYANEPDNKYYTQTLAIALIKTHHYQKAQPLIQKTIDSGMNDKQFQRLLKEHLLE